jgi:glucose/arabinose dehydrogenase
VFPHGFAIGGRKTPLLEHGKTAVLTVVFRQPGKVAYRGTVPGDAAAGMKGVLTVVRPRSPAPTTTTTTTAQPTTTAPLGVGVQLTKIGDFARPVLVTAPLGDSHRVFVVEQGGTIRELVDDQLRPQPFLDLRGEVVEVTERGMLAAAFAPDYALSGRFYVNYTDSTGSGNINVVEYRRSAKDPDVADPTTARPILHIVKPYENHNAGMLQFGPDGNLYIAVGDGDSGVLHPPGAFAQTLDDLLGNILRIDPSPPPGDEYGPYRIPDTNPFAGRENARAEIWDYGLRNPWRFWIDAVTGDLYVGDPGLERAEEIDYVQGNVGGQNFGWPCFEGTLTLAADANCPGAVAPIYEYRGEGRCAVIAGVVVRDPRLPSLAGRFLFGDYCDGGIESMLVVDGKATDVRDVGLAVPTLSSFGVDGRGRVYVTATDGGVYRLDPAS